MYTSVTFLQQCCSVLLFGSKWWHFYCGSSKSDSLWSSVLSLMLLISMLSGYRSDHSGSLMFFALCNIVVLWPGHWMGACGFPAVCCSVTWWWSRPPFFAGMMPCCPVGKLSKPWFSTEWTTSVSEPATWIWKGVSHEAAGPADWSETLETFNFRVKGGELVKLFIQQMYMNRGELLKKQLFNLADWSQWGGVARLGYAYQLKGVNFLKEVKSLKGLTKLLVLQCRSEKGWESRLLV